MVLVPRLRGDDDAATRSLHDRRRPFVGRWLRALGALITLGVFAGLGVWLYPKLRSPAA